VPAFAPAVGRLQQHAQRGLSPGEGGVFFSTMIGCRLPCAPHSSDFHG
jgi:hypothetical protein